MGIWTLGNGATNYILMEVQTCLSINGHLHFQLWYCWNSSKEKALLGLQMSKKGIFQHFCISFKGKANMTECGDKKSIKSDNIWWWLSMTEKTQTKTDSLIVVFPGQPYHQRRFNCFFIHGWSNLTSVSWGADRICLIEKVTYTFLVVFPACLCCFCYGEVQNRSTIKHFTHKT